MYGVYYADIMQFIGQNTAHNHSLSRISGSNIGSPFWALTVILVINQHVTAKLSRWGCG